MYTNVIYFVYTYILLWWRLKFTLKIKNQQYSTQLHFTRVKKVKKPVEQCIVIRTPHTGLIGDHLIHSEEKESPKGHHLEIM